MPVVHLVRELREVPSATWPPRVDVRNFVNAEDVERWLELYHRSFEGQRPEARTWTASDFRREISDKPWWSHQRTWYAEAQSPAHRNDGGGSSGEKEAQQPLVVGAITLGERGSRASSQAAVYWLLVLPEWRRQGIGRALLTTLERRAWEDGYRSIAVETHSDWRAALNFYIACGYMVT